MKTILTTIAVAFALLFGAGAATAAGIDRPEPDAVSYDLMPASAPLAQTDFTPDEWAAMNPASADPLEDEPGWDCRIHGNKSCVPLPAGPGTEITEDDPRWDCYGMGNLVCGPDKEHLTAEAWERFDPSVLPASIVAKGFEARYMGTMRTGTPYLTDSWHTYHPSSVPGLTHVFAITY